MSLREELLGRVESRLGEVNISRATFEARAAERNGVIINLSQLAVRGLYGVRQGFLSRSVELLTPEARHWAEDGDW